MEWCPPLYLSVVDIEKGPFGSPSTNIANLLMYVFVSMILVSLHREILLMSVIPCCLRCSFISSREHRDFITLFEKFRVK